MPDTLDKAPIFRMLQQIQEGQAAIQATLMRLERALSGVTGSSRKPSNGSAISTSLEQPPP